MPDLLLELLSEEIPARMQGRAAEDLRKLVTDSLVAQGLLYEGAVAHATPRRLMLHVAGLPAKAKDVREEKRGPRVGAPEAAVAGFRKSAGVTSDDQIRIVEDAKKGDYYLATIERPGRPTPQVLSELLPGIIRNFPWPKSMRWGAASAEPGSLRWVRPLQSVLCAFGSDLETAEIVPLLIDGLVSGDATRGHRFMAPATIRARRYDDYVAKLHAAKVVLDAGRRREIIRHDARDLAFAQGFEVVEDEGLLEEVAGLVEWPVCLMGGFEEGFLDIPPEVIRATIRANQKCFVLRRALPSSGEGRAELANRFILVANIEASDGGKAIVAGNERVGPARLWDGKVFWGTRREGGLGERPPQVESLVFHEKLGTQYERVERIAALARALAPVVGAEIAEAERAARLAKADLVTEMVGEFPELQGLMGRYYAAAQGEAPAVAAAIEDHYRPAGPSDRIPSAPVTLAVALADKLDTLVGFWAIDEKPTGSKDPYALRRAALGVIRLVLENDVRLGLGGMISGQLRENFEQSGQDGAAGIRDDLLTFFHDRLKVHLRERGARYDLIDAVLAAGSAPPSPLVGEAEQARSAAREGGNASASGTPGEGVEPSHPVPGPGPRDPSLPAASGGRVGAGNDDLLMIVRRVEALSRFLETEDGRNLLAATKRAANILRIEEKKDGRSYDEIPDLAALAEPEEKALAIALARAAGAATEAVAREALEEAMSALAELRPAVDAFFDKVTVNAPDPKLRENRLRLLAMLRRATREVADFSRIEG